MANKNDIKDIEEKVNIVMGSRKSTGNLLGVSRQAIAQRKEFDDVEMKKIKKAGKKRINFIERTWNELFPEMKK